MCPFHASSRLNWYVVQTKPKQEDRAVLNLKRWGVETLAPRLRELRSSRAAGASYRIAPLFPGYVFARFDAAALLAKVRLTRGVSRVVGFGESATPLSDAAVELIRVRMREDGSVRPDPLQPGDAVRIVDGPLRSLLGVFERSLRGEDRVLILLSLMGSQARVQLPAAFIERTPACALV